MPIRRMDAKKGKPLGPFKKESLPRSHDAEESRSGVLLSECRVLLLHAHVMNCVPVMESDGDLFCSVVGEAMLSSHRQN